ncbi:MAG: O-antigen ligase family protein, partial [Planctomycetota bacterium]
MAPDPDHAPAPPRDDARIAALLRDARDRDPLGHRIQTALAGLHLFMLPLASAPSSITFGLLLANTLLRLPHTWRCYAPLGRLRLGWLLAAWFAWTAASVAWSSDPVQGIDELSASRMLLLPLLLWPLVDRLPWMVGAALAGVFAQNLVQLGQWARVPGLEPEPDGRLPGLIHAGHTGAWCAAAIVWHLAAAIRGPRLVRVLAIGGLVAAAAGLVGSGARGPWLATLVSVPLVPLVIAIRRPGERRKVLVAVAVALVVGAVAAPVAWPAVRPRLETAAREYRAAREDGVYWTSVGLRPAMWSWAWTIWKQAPVAGIGAGGYREAVTELEDYRRAAARKRRKAEWMLRDHCHSIYLQALATTGAIGLALLA